MTKSAKKGAGKKPAPKKNSGLSKAVAAIGRDGATFVPSDANPKDLLGQKKADLSLIPMSASIYAALALDNGRAKYGRGNWRDKKVLASIYIAAARRHMDAWMEGEEVSDDTSNPAVPHLGHALASLCILVDAIEGSQLIDDRPKAGPGPKTLKKFMKV